MLLPHSSTRILHNLLRSYFTFSGNNHTIFTSVSVLSSLETDCIFITSSLSLSYNADTLFQILNRASPVRIFPYFINIGKIWPHVFSFSSIFSYCSYSSLARLHLSDNCFPRLHAPFITYSDHSHNILAFVQLLSHAVSLSPWWHFPIGT